MHRIGVDFGGTKIEAAVLDDQGQIIARRRRPNPGAYVPALTTVAELVAEAEDLTGTRFARVGVGMPGSISPATGVIRNANSTWLNGRRFGEDLTDVLGRPVRLANDANCLALSEAADGAAAGAGVVFAAILGTGCGGGVVAGGRLLEGANGVAGEWGHTPLPWARAEEHPGPACWCGRRGCLETWISGPALAADHGQGLDAVAIAQAAVDGAADAQAALGRYQDRLARALAVVVDLIDPDVIVLGGGMSNVDAIYKGLSEKVATHVFADTAVVDIRRAQHGDSSGVRGAAWLWPVEAP